MEIVRQEGTTMPRYGYRYVEYYKLGGLVKVNEGVI